MTTTPTYETMLAAGRDGAPEAVRVERHGDRAVVTLAEPERLNALSAPLVSQLKAARASSPPTGSCARSFSPATIPASPPAATCA